MKRRRTRIKVSDHAMLRWLEREHGLDRAALQRHLAGLVLNGAELGAIAVCVDNVRLVLKRTGKSTVVTTTLSRAGSFHPDGGK